MGSSKNQGGMGFQDLALFNKVLLAKQIWRLLEDPSSLVARIMQAKYHPQCLVMEAPLGRKPYFAWRSISSAQSMIKNKLVLRVCNGRDIKIWGGINGFQSQQLMQFKLQGEFWRNKQG
jgi:hypothetical protein